MTPESGEPCPRCRRAVLVDAWRTEGKDVKVIALCRACWSEWPPYRHPDAARGLDDGYTRAVVGKETIIWRQPPRAPIPPREFLCVICGLAFVSPSTSARYCSTPCRSAGRERVEAARHARVERDAACAWCDAPFTTTSPERRFCGPRCIGQYAHAQMPRRRDP